MKREIYIYSILGIITCFLIFYQFNFQLDEEESIASSIKEIKGIKQLSIDINCNVFFVEGEGEHILMEGPAKKLLRIETSIHDGFVNITEHKRTFLAGIFSFLNIEENNINIYITVNDLDSFNFSFIDESKSIKYTSGECIGLILQKGQKILIESILINSRL